MASHIWTTLGLGLVAVASYDLAFAADAPALAPTSQDVEMTPTGAFVWTEVLQLDYDAAKTASMMTSNALGALAVDSSSSKRLTVHIARLTDGKQIRVSFIDNKGVRHVGRPRGMASGEKVAIFAFESPDTCPASSVRAIVFEQRVPATDEATLMKVSPLPRPAMGKSYSFVLTDLAGKAIDSSSLRGRVVVLNFWATWCAPAVAQVPSLKHLHNLYRKQGLEIVGVDMAEEPQELSEFVRKNGIAWPQVVLNDQEAEAAQAVAGISSLPRYLVLDRQGRLAADVAAGELEEAVRALLASSPSTAPASRASTGSY